MNILTYIAEFCGIALILLIIMCVVLLIWCINDEEKERR